VLGREFAPVLVWALFLAALTAVQFAFMHETYSYGLLGGAVLVTLSLGLFLVVRRRVPGEGARHLADLSYPTVILALGAALAIVGAAVGAWLYLPGLGVLLLGAGALLRERRRA
jgi:hypothetical protein